MLPVVVVMFVKNRQVSRLSARRRSNGLGPDGDAARPTMFMTRVSEQIQDQVWDQFQGWVDDHVDEYHESRQTF